MRPDIKEQLVSFAKDLAVRISRNRHYDIASIFPLTAYSASGVYACKSSRSMRVFFYYSGGQWRAIFPTESVVIGMFLYFQQTYVYAGLMGEIKFPGVTPEGPYANEEMRFGETDEEAKEEDEPGF